MSFFRSLSRCFAHSPSYSHTKSSILSEKVTRPEELSPKHNIFEEEDELYIPEETKHAGRSDYIIKTAKNNIPLGPESVKPLIREGLNASTLMCLRDVRHNNFHDSLIGTVETSLGHGLIYFNCFPNKTVSLLDQNILDALFLNIRLHGLDMKEGSIPTALIYRIQYKVMNTCNSRVLLKTTDRETTLFVTDMTKANVTIPRLIKWDEINLPESWARVCHTYSTRQAP
ncbi:polyprotein [Arachis hypogaea]|nr:polyprotein [Arachis hypogaea]